MEDRTECKLLIARESPFGLRMQAISFHSVRWKGNSHA